jgi:biopolymer transport protein ExbB
MEYLHTLIDYGILGLLVLMSVVALSLAMERWLVYRAVDVEQYTERKVLELHISHKLHLIATIGANAPYIGLLGTVLGIMLTFYDIGAAGFDTTKIMTGLALALKATALGLLVAIPAVTLYNLLLRRCKVLLMQWDIHHGREGV